MKNTVKFSGADVSRQIKKELAAKFPGIKFSVRYSSYSGGDSVRANWSFGPTVSEVEQIIEKYQHGRFDGMTDSYNYEETKVIDETGNYASLGGVKYVFAERNISEDFTKLVCAAICKQYGEEWNGIDFILKNHNEWVSTLAYRIIRKNSFKTEAPQFLELVRLEGVTCGHFEEFYTVAVSEIINGQEVKTDSSALIIASLKEELKETETRLYKALSERDEYSAKYYNLQQEIRNEKIAAIKPFVINTSEKRLFVANSMYAGLNKQSTLADYQREIKEGAYDVAKTKINGVICLNDEAYEFFANNLMENFDFLEGFGGTDSDEPLTEEQQKNIYALYNDKAAFNKWMAKSYRLGALIYHPTKECFLVDTQGYKYARYAGLLTEETQQELREYVESKLL